MAEPVAKPHILVVDDDDRLRALLSRYLRGQGFAVGTAADAVQARQQLGWFRFDLMVLDVMMPGESGLSLAGWMKKTLPFPPPVLMLSARSETEDRVAGLQAGVDDYLTKPFDPTELSLRIRAILRRVVTETPAARSVRFGDYRFDPASGQLQLGEAHVALTAAESALLKVLSQHLGQPVSRRALAEATGQETLSERSIDVQVTRLRKKIEAPEGRPQYLQTLRGAGYVLYGSNA